MAHANDNPLRHEMFNHFDTNKDGFLQKHEFVYANFLAMDHNGLYDDANNNCKNITTNSSQFVVILVLMYLNFCWKVTTKFQGTTLTITTQMYVYCQLSDYKSWYRFFDIIHDFQLLNN